MRLRIPSRRKGPGHPYGTIPYHRHYERLYRRLQWFWVGMAIWMAVEVTLVSFHWLNWVYAGLAFFAGTQWWSARTEVDEHRMRAWTVEAQGLADGMASSGIHDFPDFVRALGEGPPPPGVSEADWRRMHEETLRKMKEAGFE